MGATKRPTFAGGSSDPAARFEATIHALDAAASRAVAEFDVDRVPDPESEWPRLPPWSFGGFMRRMYV